MKIKTFLLSFIIVYLVLSLPALFGIGFVIDWVPEATLLQKINGYVLIGLTDNYLFKFVIAGLISIVLQLVMSKRQRN
ncbi:MULTISPECIES: hypothetical protein [unclassified Exiguobacterium]|uniref:hypothetical protein n=1 Tax=unclassified Exiguobacterium TaxID=2644629 RepID=UPI001BEB4C22|nr:MULTISPECIES: hypothetical protein [unclassified Exiguobacterium]